MGFGILFIGYFFLVNISFFGFTDIIAAMVMLSALYQLGNINRSFKNAFTADICFSVFAFIELGLAIPSVFGIEIAFIDMLSTYISAIRYCIIFVLNLFILRGIEEVAREVDASALARTAKASLPLSIVYLFASVFSFPFLSSLLGKATAYIYFAIILAIFVYVISNLIVIYKAYMQICMPGQEKSHKKKSKIDPMGKFYDSLEQKGKEYAEYKLKKKAQKAEKKRQSNNHNSKK